ncbi:hypothetical protein E2I00_014625, partial [Balaenoptera physalus]
PPRSGAVAGCSAGPSSLVLASGLSSPIILSQNCMKNAISPGQLLSKNHQTWSPIEPDTIHVPVGIHVQEVFDCRKPRFSKIVLKPQYKTREAHQVFILGPMSRKNSTAAKCSCHAWRLKENEIVAQETSALRVQAKHTSL